MPTKSGPTPLCHSLTMWKGQQSASPHECSNHVRCQPGLMAALRMRPQLHLSLNTVQFMEQPTSFCNVAAEFLPAAISAAQTKSHSSNRLFQTRRPREERRCCVQRAHNLNQVNCADENCCAPCHTSGDVRGLRPQRSRHQGQQWVASPLDGSHGPVQPPRASPTSRMTIFSARENEFFLEVSSYFTAPESLLPKQLELGSP